MRDTPLVAGYRVSKYGKHNSEMKGFNQEAFHEGICVEPVKTNYDIPVVRVGLLY